MASQGGGGFGGSQGAGSPAKKERASQLSPVTIRQVQQVSPDNIMIDGKEVSQVTIVGVILQVDVQSTNTNYMIDDGSGKINVRHYPDADDEDEQMRAAGLREDVYVRVIGNIREVSGAISIIAFTLVPITDFNELTFHLLEVIHGHLLNTKGGQGPMAVASSAATTPVKSFGGASFAGAPGGPPPMASFNQQSIQDQVMEVFRQDTSESGAHINEVMQKLSHIGPLEIRKAVEFLGDEGHLYSTVDEEHFKCTDPE